jgi:glycosyltransferase involved in cell wall biosynthesis
MYQSMVSPSKHVGANLLQGTGTKPKDKVVSIVIVNYNYARYLQDAIESALNQSYPSVEVVVVDDGSTDQSLRILNSYRDRCIFIQKENGGQASAMNLGFAMSRGEWILFLDADDALFPQAISNFIDHTTPSHLIAKLHAPLVTADSSGDLLGQTIPYQPLASGDLESTLLRWGPESYVCSPTSGNLWSRSMLSSVLPIPEKTYRISADAYLFTLAPLFGQIIGLESPVGCYRLHGCNTYWQSNISLKQLRGDIIRYGKRASTLENFVRRSGVIIKARFWKLRNRYYLAKVAILYKLQNRSLPDGFLLLCLRASIIAPITFLKRFLWVIWFISLWLSPPRLSHKVIMPFMQLRTRL